MTSLKQIQEYRDDPAWSQSDLKGLLYNGTRGKPSLTMLLGSYLDVMLLTPELEDDLFYIKNVNRPTDKIQELCESLLKWVDPSPVLEDHRKDIEQWIDTEDYYNNRPATRVQKFIDEAAEWWNVLVLRGDREIITDIEELETELLVNRLTCQKEYDYLWEGEFQKPFYWTERGVDCKGLGDICLEDEYVDLKYTTCSSFEEWLKVCAKLNYPFQMAFYKSGLGVKKCKWLVVNKDWHRLVDVTDLMLQVGRWGYKVPKEIRIGKVVYNFEVMNPGYEQGLDLVLNLQQDSNIDNQYIRWLTEH